MPVLLFGVAHVPPFALCMGIISMYNYITNNMKEIISTSGIVRRGVGAILGSSTSAMKPV